jgi:transketolase
MSPARRKTDLRDPKSFDHVGRDAGANQFVIGRVLADLGDRYPDVVAATADLKYVTKLAEFEDRHPTRFFQFGISERNMFSAAAGLASCGLIPYVATFAAFAGVLGYENIRTDMAYTNLPVRVLGTHCGISLGFFGTSHHATEDIAALRAVANMTIYSPTDATSLASLIETTVEHPGPMYFRIGRGAEQELYASPPMGYGTDGAHVVRTGRDVLIVATGIMVAAARDAADALEQRGISATVVDAYRIKPFPSDRIADLANAHRLVVTVEEHNVEGGLGTLVREALAEARISIPVFKHGLHDEFGIVGPPTHLYRYYGLDPVGIEQVVSRAVARLESGGIDVRSPLWTTPDREAVQSEQDDRTRASGSPFLRPVRI